MAHFVLRQSLSIGLVQNDLHNAEDLLCYRCPSTVLTLLLSYQRLTGTNPKFKMVSLKPAYTHLY